jgi:NADH dehydrogenase
MPFIYLASPDAKFQPVYVGDVAEVMVRALFDRDCYGQSFNLCGPKVYTLRQLVEYTGHASGRRRPIIGLGRTLSIIQASVMERLPMKLLTRDNLRSMQVASVCDADFPLGITPTAMEAMAPSWLAGHAPRLRLYGMRARAHR